MRGSQPPSTSREVSVRRWRDGKSEHVDDVVAEEAPVALTYHGVPHVVMLATPADLEDLGVGFTLSEAIVGKPEEIRSVELLTDDGALEVRMGIASERFSEVLKRQRNLTGRTGCGMCGAETIEEAIRRPAPVGAGPHMWTRILGPKCRIVSGIGTALARHVRLAPSVRPARPQPF